MSELPLFDYAPLSYSTGHFKPAEKRALDLSAADQESRVLRHFGASGAFTASEVWQAVRKHDLEPLTSIRRAMTNLCKRGLLVKTDATRVGIYGKQEHIYKTLSRK
jgi:predicted transcriptional regulator